MKLVLGAAIAVAAVIGGSPASAVVLIATYTGTVQGGGDWDGEFGTRYADLTGRTYTATYTYDTSLGRDYVGSYFEELVNEFPYGTPILDSTLTIGTGTVHVTGEGYGHVFSANNNGNFACVGNAASGNSRFLSSNLCTNTAPTTLPISFSSGLSGPYASGDSYYQSPTGNNPVRFYADFVTIRAVTEAAVPEPATWSLMLMGFGGLGAVLRRRRALPSSAPA